MTDAQSILLLLLAKALFHRQIELPETDYRWVLQEAKSQAVVQLSFSALDHSMLSEEEISEWQVSASSNLANNIRIIHNHTLLHQWMTESGIPYVILKGCSSAHYYPIPEYRSMGDVDFLVPKDYIEKAGIVLESKDLKSWNTEHISHVVYRKKGMHLEMHYNVAGTPNGVAGDLVRNYLEDIFKKASIQGTGNGEVIIPSSFHHGLILLLHTTHHLTGEGVGLRHLCDWAVFANHFSNDEFCQIFENKLKQIGLWKFAQILTRISINYLQADEKEWAACEDSIVDELMKDILTGGNFGRKDSNRALQTMLISNRGKNGVGNTSMLREFTKSMNDVVTFNWPKSKDLKFLLPIGWVYFGGRRIIRELTGKRKRTNIRKLVDGSDKRRTLYQQFHLYEREEE